MTELTQNDIFQRGCLIQTSIGTWDPWKTMPKEMDGWIKKRKKLIDEEYLTDIKKTRNKVNVLISSYTLPFPIRGINLVSRETIIHIEERLESLKAEFFEQVDSFLLNYDILKREAYELLAPKGMYNESDYPMDVRSRFKFEWRYLVLDVPNNGTGILSPELYERERAKFIETMNQARELAVEALRIEFADIVNHMVERLQPAGSGKTKIFKNSLVGNFHEFFETFQHRNMFNDESLNEIVEQAKGILQGVTPDKLRENEIYKHQIKQSMNQVKELVDNLIIDAPTRKLKMT